MKTLTRDVIGLPAEPNAADMLRAEDALALHASVAARVQRDRAPLLSAAFPLALFGTLSVASGFAAVLLGPSAFVAGWALAGPVGFAAIMTYFWRLEDRTALRAPRRRAAAALAGATVVAAFVIAAVASHPTSPFLGVALGYLAFGTLWGNRALGLCAAGIVAIATVVAITNPARPEAWLAFAVGALQLVCAQLDRVRQTP